MQGSVAVRFTSSRLEKVSADGAERMLFEISRMTLFCVPRYELLAVDE